MNEDAEREIERIMDMVFSCLRVAGPHEVRRSMDAIARWVYADAAKACRECNEVIGEHRTGYIIRAIEARAK